MKEKIPYIKNFIVTLLILVITFVFSLILQNLFWVQENITTVFVFAVFLISLWTDGYIYGIVAAFVSTIAVNYAFTRANLLRAVSHDLRTPLTTIYGSASALLENRKSLTEEQKSKMLRGITEDAQWLVRMVENLLSITKIDSGNVKIIKTPTVLDELIDSVILKFRKRYPEQDVQLDLPEEIVVIPMDALLMEQVLINILENAVQHGVGLTRLCLKVFLLAGQAIFEISDNGCGINEEKLPHIFSGYYESKDYTADSQKRNAGIGLSVCATIVKAHGGDITAENAKTGGAVFRFTLNTEDLEDEQ